MINRTHRFHGPSSLSFVYRRGQSVRGLYNALKYIQNERTTSYRVSVVVSRKVSKSAVVRNRIRRRLYAQMDDFEGSIQGNYDLVFVVYDQALRDVRPKELHDMMAGQLTKAGVISARPARGGTITTKESKK